MYKRLLLISPCLFIMISAAAQRPEDFITVTEDGAWCWFSDPRAVYYKGIHERTYTGFVTSLGDIIVACKGHRTGDEAKTLIYHNLQADDHVNPSLLVLPDGRLMIFFTRHGGKVYYTTSEKPEEIYRFSNVDSLDLGKMACYTNPVLLRNENNRIYLFFRGGYDWKPSFISSDDYGNTWSEAKTIVSKKINNIHNRPYTKIVSDGNSVIHFAFTDGHPRDENYYSIYYLKYESGNFFDAAGRFSTDLSSENIMKVMSAVADWQIDNFASVPHHQLDWTNGALYAGMMEFAKISPDRKNIDWLYRIGRSHGWQPHRNMYHADDIAVCQMYLEMYRQKKTDRDSYLILAPTQARLDYVISHPIQGSLLLDYSDPQTTESWSWCDALFMAPPVYAKMSVITGDNKYLEFMDREYKATYEFLYDTDEFLFYRDHRYFPEKILEANGRKVFWGRGNGWVMGGLVALLKELPANSVYRPFYERLFAEMAEKVASCQDREGFWHASMLDPQSFPNPETSSSSFFCYALAYGVNSGLLDKEIYTPVVINAWQALVSAVHADGKLGWVQPVGQDPKIVTSDMTEVYGVGAFLLAGTEMMMLSNTNAIRLMDQ